jgi:hypothetical protein
VLCCVAIKEGDDIFLSLLFSFTEPDIALPLGFMGENRLIHKA